MQTDSASGATRFRTPPYGWRLLRRSHHRHHRTCGKTRCVACSCTHRLTTLRPRPTIDQQDQTQSTRAWQNAPLPSVATHDTLSVPPGGRALQAAAELPQALLKSISAPLATVAPLAAIDTSTRSTTGALGAHRTHALPVLPCATCLTPHLQTGLVPCIAMFAHIQVEWE